LGACIVNQTKFHQDTQILRNTFVVNGKNYSAIVDSSDGAMKTEAIRLRDNVIMRVDVEPTGTHGLIRYRTDNPGNFALDYDLLHDSAGRMVSVSNTHYATLAAFQAVQPSQEVHGMETADHANGDHRLKGLVYSRNCASDDAH
jgi:hypothetical protein